MNEPNQQNACNIQQFADRVLRDAGNGLCALLAATGCKLGLYRALAEASVNSKSLSASELATRCGLVEQYVRNWLAAQLAAGYVSLDGSIADKTAPRFYLNDAQQAVFAREEHPQCHVARLLISSGIACNVVQRMEKEFREGRGILWSDNHSDNFVGHDMIFKKEFGDHVLIPFLKNLPEMLVKRLEGDGSPVLLLDMACDNDNAVNELATRWPLKIFTLGIDTQKPYNVASRVSQSELPNALVIKGNMCAIPLPHEIPELDNKWSSFNSQHTLPTYFDVATIIMTLHLFAHPLIALRSIRKALNPSHGLLIVFEPGSKEPSLETLGQGFSDAYLVAAGTALCGPCALADVCEKQSGVETDEVEIISHLSCDEEYFSIARQAGFKNINKFSDRVFVFSG